MYSLRNLAVGVIVSLSVAAAVANAQNFAPGTINYVEGQVTLNGKPVAVDNPEAAVVSRDEVLQTEQGRAEVLLSPGVYLRVGENSSVKIDAAPGKDIRMELVRGEALVEVDQTARNRHLDMIDKGGDAHLDQAGIYLFNTSQPAIAVYAGRIRVEDDRRGIALGAGQELLLASTNGLKAEKFDRSATDAVYAWSLKRADAASQISEWMGEAILGLDSQSTHNDGWYWSSWYKSWAFIPAKGYVVTPFGYGLYAPLSPHYTTPVFADFRK
jgi:hypothetical protein